MGSTELKRIVAFRAVDEFVQSGMYVGLGTGSTAYFAVQRIGEKLSSGILRDVVCVATSSTTEQQARSLNVPLVTLDDRWDVDVAIDGADEVDDKLNLIKGRGAALFREKVVESCAKFFCVIVDEQKLVGKSLGATGAIPVEVASWCWKVVQKKITELGCLDGCNVKLRGGEKNPISTDNGNFLLDIYVDKPIANPEVVAQSLSQIPGVIEHGIFLGMANVCLVGKKDGSVQFLRNSA